MIYRRPIKAHACLHPHTSQLKKGNYFIVKNKEMASHFIILVFLVAIFSSALASDSSPLQDFCVADLTGPGTIIYIYATIVGKLSFVYIFFIN